MNIFVVMLHDCHCGRSHIINVFDNEDAAKACKAHEESIKQMNEIVKIHNHIVREVFNV